MAVSTPVGTAIAARRLADLATPFGVPSGQVDGTDVVAVRAAMTLHVARARAGEGPGFLECLSERFASHSSSTRETRSAAEMDRIRARCPIRRLRNEMEAEGLDLSDLDSGVRAEVERALAFAEASAFPDPSEGLTDVD
jgi:pyruvate dehydrogenase E1 component alpha subunit